MPSLISQAIAGELAQPAKQPPLEHPDLIPETDETFETFETEHEAVNLQTTSDASDGSDVKHFSSIHQHQHRRVLRRFHHILKRFVLRVRIIQPQNHAHHAGIPLPQTCSNPKTGARNT